MSNRIEYAGMTFDNEQIVSGEIYDAVSLLCDALEIGTFQVELYVADESIGQKLMSFKRNAPLEYYKDGLKRGIWYVESVQRTGKFTYEILANNAVALLEQSDHMGGIYTGQTVEEVVADICSIPYIVKSALAGAKLYGWLPIAPRRANLAQVLFVIGAVAKVDQNGVLRIESLWSGTSNAVAPDRVFWGDKVKYESVVTEVSVLEHQYVKGAEETTLFEGTAQSGDRIIFGEPMHTLTASGLSILERGDNYAVLSAGSGTLTGKKYIHTTRAVRKEVAAADAANVVEVKNATLVSLVNSVAVVERLAAYYACVQTMDNDVVHQRERAGDVTTFEHPYGGDSFGTVKSVAVSLGNQGAVASEKTVIGYRPPEAEDVEYFDYRVLLTGSGTWTPPEGVDTVTAVLVGAGDGGGAGNEGGTVPIPESSSSTDTQFTDHTDYYNGIEDSAVSHSEGGAPGTPGAGGKVNVVTLAVSSSSAVSYSCGVGGLGEVFGGASAKAGGSTTFGSQTSANGASSDAGYADVFTGEILAAKGKSGIPGGPGAGMQENEDGTYSEFVPPAIVVDGVSYYPGSRGASKEVSDGSYNEDYGSHLAVASGGFGGGAAYKANGHDGEAGSVSISGDPPRRATAYAGLPGKGADALPPPKETVYGKGGTSGNGGGGAGQFGYPTYARNRVGKNATKGYDPIGKANGSAAAAGKGSDGGQGADGCIILYYRVPKDKGTGALMEKSKQLLLDKSGRILIV